MAYRIVNANHPDPMLKRKPRRARIIWHSARQRRAARSLAAIATPPNATLLQNFSIYLPGLALPFALFPPLPPFVPFPPLPPFALFPPLPPFPTFEPPPDAAMAAEVRLVESNMVTAGGVIAAKRPQAFETSRLSSSRVNLLSDALPMLILQLDALVLQKFLMILDIILYTGQIANTSTTSAPAASSQSYSEALL